MIDADSPAGADAVDILVVDDVEQNRLALRALLERSGVRVLCAESGVRALELLLDHDVALALLDVQMPDMDGFELAELMRGAERTRAVPIIFVTAAALDAQRSFRGYEAGAVDFLHKPIDPKILRSKTEVFVELHTRRRELHRRMAELEQVLLLNETMMAVLTHDLRTPLSAITLSAELLARTASDDTVRQGALRMKSSAARMSRMISQLLDFSRLRSGTLRLDVRSVDLGELFGSAIAELQQAAPQARIEFQACGDLEAALDQDRMSQVFSNLLSNAVRHGDPHGVVRVVLDGSRHDEISACIDNPGRIAVDVRQRLFKPFRSPTAGSEGLGLGLYIVEQFVRAHHGSVAVDATPDGRVAFVVSVPRRQPEPGSASAAQYG
ncbi:MAG: hybrid sensor histidine kinase/response regulator [Burkholderiaceae bacterium]|nr:hybrid sensor histidine kinase/response regulator [Burkholderiaceae bacterium]